MIIELVGTQFKRSYLSEENDNPWLLVRHFFNERVELFIK